VMRSRAAHQPLAGSAGAPPKARQAKAGRQALGCLRWRLAPASPEIAQGHEPRAQAAQVTEPLDADRLAQLGDLEETRCLGGCLNCHGGAGCTQPGERGRELAQSSLRDDAAKPELEFLVEGDPGLCEKALAPWS
jgi:hypothetical protein